ncbi:MAG: hypothetical protein ACE5PM_08465 [Candidatus Hydrothermarchaeales archaeon]
MESEEKPEEKKGEEEKPEGKPKIKLEVRPEFKDLFVGTVGLGLIGGGLFGCLVFFILFNLVAIPCVADSYIISEGANIAYFSFKLLFAIGLLSGLIFSFIYRNVESGKFRKILIAVFAVEVLFAISFVLIFEVPHCENFQTLIGSKPISRGEITIIDERQLTTEEAWDTYPSWSPDGSKILFLRERPGEFDIIGIWIINKDGSNPKRMISARLEVEHPSWSPDGSKIAFASWESGNRDIWTIDIYRGTLTQLTKGDEGDISPVWSPDGSKILFVKVGTKDQDIWMMDSDGGNGEQLTSGKANDKHPSWSPDGSKILFVRDESGSSNIWTMNNDGSGLRQLTSDRATKSHPSWSPDGSKIAFVSRPPTRPESLKFALGGQASDYDTLWVVNSDGTDQRQLSPDRVDDVYTWSPDGDMIAFVKIQLNYAKLWVVSSDGSYERELPISQTFPINPAWSPDGSRMVYSVFGTGRRNLWAAILSQ